MFNDDVGKFGAALVKRSRRCCISGRSRVCNIRFSVSVSELLIGHAGSSTENSYTVTAVLEGTVGKYTRNGICHKFRHTTVVSVGRGKKRRSADLTALNIKTGGIENDVVKVIISRRKVYDITPCKVLLNNRKIAVADSGSDKGRVAPVVFAAECDLEVAVRTDGCRDSGNFRTR